MSASGQRGSRRIDELPGLVDGRAQIRVPHRAEFDKIDGAVERVAKRVHEVEILVEQRETVYSSEFHEEVGVARLGVEIRAARRRAEDLQPHDAVAPTERGKFLPLVGDGGVHGDFSCFRCQGYAP